MLESALATGPEKGDRFEICPLSSSNLLKSSYTYPALFGIDHKFGQHINIISVNIIPVNFISVNIIYLNIIPDFAEMTKWMKLRSQNLVGGIGGMA